jgi:hypothetical protein
VCSSCRARKTTEEQAGSSDRPETRARARAEPSLSSMAQPPGEIITLQLGNFANYVGAHFWNLQVGSRDWSRARPSPPPPQSPPSPPTPSPAPPPPKKTPQQDELLGYASLPPPPSSSSLAETMAAPAVAPAAAATVEPSVLFELRDGGGGGGGGGGNGDNNNGLGRHGHGQQPYAVPRLVCLDASGSTGGVSFSADAAAQMGGGGASQQGGAARPLSRPCSSTTTALHRAPPIPKSAFVRALEAQEILLRQLALGRQQQQYGGGGFGPAAASVSREAAARLEEQQQRQLEAAARALDEAAEEAGLDLSSEHHHHQHSSSSSSSSVRYWTDYLKTRLHPRTPVLVRGAWHTASHELDGYGGGGSGGASARSGAGGGSGGGLGGGHGGGAGGPLSGGAGCEAAEAVVDALRRWGEGCDRLQGVQVLADDMCGLGGALGAAVLREVADDLFPRRALAYFSVRGPDRPGSVVVGGGGRGGGGGGEEEDEGDDDDNEDAPGRGTGHGAGTRIGGGGGSEGGGGPAGARQRQLLSEALSAAEAACPEDGFASLYVPLAAPAPGSAEARALPWLSSSSAAAAIGGASTAAFRASALLAAAIDTATLPTRITLGCPAADVGPAVGAGVSLAELCATLQARPSAAWGGGSGGGGGGGGRMAALGLALPALAVCSSPSSLRGVPGADDPRVQRQQQHELDRSLLYESMALPAVASLTPGVRIGARAAASGADNSSSGGPLLSESVVLRGARDASTGKPAGLATASAALDEALLSERRRRQKAAGGGGGSGGGGIWLQQRCVAAPPLAVPLPFPGLFSARVTRDGCVSRGGPSGGGGGGGGHHVAAAPALTRLAASPAFSGRLAAMARGLRASAPGGLGTVAATWGYDRAELAELSERLTRMA